MAATQNKRYIFLVDDEPIQNEMLKDYITERFNYEIKTYDNGEDALKDMDLNPEIAVLDFHLNAHLPNAQNGVEVLKKMKAQYPNTEVIMLSGQDKLDVAVDSMKNGAYDYVVKGETAFSRMENVINNINELRAVRSANKSYRNVITFLVGSLVVIMALSVYLVKKLR